MFGDGAFWVERRPDFSHGIEHAAFVFEVSNGDGETVAGTAAWIDKGGVLVFRMSRAFVHAILNAGLDHLASDEALDIAAELRAVLGRRPTRVALGRLRDDALGHGRVHRPGVGMPDEDGAVVLAVITPVGFP